MERIGYAFFFTTFLRTNKIISTITMLSPFAAHIRLKIVWKLFGCILDIMENIS